MNNNLSLHLTLQFMKKLIRKYWLYIIALCLGSCANIVTPGGGPKDDTAPKVLSTIPANNSLHFAGNSVRINFDEFVKLSNAATEVVVSPFMKESPEIKVKGRAIVVNFIDTLKSATTYTISFGKSITDNNEGNVLLNYRYAFSTGDMIDTLVLVGAVKNALTLKSESGVLVMLYNENYDSIPYKETPFYISKTDEVGNFNFSNVKNGNYKIFALKDANNNFLYDPTGEMIAFRDSLITPQPLDTAKADSLKKNGSYGLYLFEELPETQKMLKAIAIKYGKLMLVFRKPVEDFALQSLSDSVPLSSIIQEISKTRDTVTLWLKKADADSVILQIKDKNILDTAVIRLTKKATKQTRGKGEDVKSTGLLTNASGSGTFDYFKSLTIESTLPIETCDFSKILLIENKDTIKAKFSFTDSVRRNIKMDYKFKEEAYYSLFIPPGTFKDIFSNMNDTLKIHFTTTSLKNYGNIKLKLKSEDLKYGFIVQLVTENDAIIQEKFSRSNDELNFIYVNPGNYKIKVIYDENNNKIWDTGNYLNKLQAEKVIYYPTTITAKPNWDLDLYWEIAK
jgi:hypothetical protein